MAMCPLISSRDKHATCGRSEDDARKPSLSEREHYCFDVYELCPYFSLSGTREIVVDNAVVLHDEMFIDMSR